MTMRSALAASLFIGIWGLSTPAHAACGWVYPRDLPIAETHVRYWRLDAELPPGASLAVRGDFPYARQMSFNVHRARDAALIGGVTDTDLQPLAGSVNPFIPGAERRRPQRQYSKMIVRAEPNAPPQAGAAMIQAAANETVRLRVLYRIYLPDADRPGGGVDLPRVWLVAADGARTQIAGQDCPRHGDVDPAQEIGPTRIPPGPGAITVPLDWRNAGAAAAAGGSDVFVNRDNSYAYAGIRMAPDSVLLLAGRAPTHPATLRGNKRMGDGQVRFWSLCAYRRPSDRSARCIADEAIAVDEQDQFHVVVGPPGSRPAPEKRCAIAWLETPALGEGALVLRHVAPRADFANTPLRGAPSEPAGPTLGDYTPLAQRLTLEGAKALCASQRQRLDE